MRRTVTTRLTTVLLLAAAGCGGTDTPPSTAPDAQQRVALNDVGELCRMYQLRAKKAPKSLKDVESLEMGGPTGLASVRNKDVVVQWGAELPDLGEEPGKTPSDKVLAYEKKVPEQGGLVLMLDRTIKSMTAEEFKSAPRAGGD